MENKLLFFDIDGTLIDCNLGIYEIPDKTIKTLDKLKASNHDVFLATGRCPCFIMDGVNSYPFSGYVTCNGSYVEYKGEEIYKSIISSEAIRKTHEFCVQHNITYYLEGKDKIYVLDKNHPKHIEFQDNWGMKAEVVIDDFDFDTIETYIGMIVVNNIEQIPAMVEALSPYYDIQRHASDFSFDLTNKGVSKATGIEKLVEKLNRDMKDTVAFGDGRNDIEMLETVSLGIAMGNACPEAKEVSDYVCPRVDEDGITKAIEYFKFI